MNTQTTTQGQDINMVELVNSLNATISELRKEIDTMKYNPSFTSSEFQSKQFKEIFDTTSMSFVSKNFNAGLNSFRKVADYLKINKLDNLRPIFGEKSGNALSILNDTLKYLGEEKIKPFNPKNKV